jgi:hypothetical protein
VYPVLVLQGWHLVEVSESIFDRWRTGFQIQSGFSYKSNQYGLTVDNVAGYELVLPNGTVQYVTPRDEDLWFGLRVSASGQAQYRPVSSLKVF